jgi:hypothetical protein
VTDLIAFLSARLDEDEQAARDAESASWSTGVPDGPIGGLLTVRRDYAPAMQDYVTGSIHDENAIHIARHDPARVLREVAAKRAVLGLVFVGDLDGTTDSGLGYQEGVMRSLELLAAAYSDHDDYDPTWSVT